LMILQTLSCCLRYNSQPYRSSLTAQLNSEFCKHL
jgi:hypothetical protein